MRKINLIGLTAIIMLVLATSCSMRSASSSVTGNAESANITEAETEPETTSAKEEKNTKKDPAELVINPTGVYGTKDDIQRIMVYYDGTLYIDEAFETPVYDIDDSYSYVGDIKVQDNKSVPSADFASTWIEKGAKVYANEDSLMVYREDYGCYTKLIICSEEQAKHVYYDCVENDWYAVGYEQGGLERIYVMVDDKLYIDEHLARPIAVIDEEYTLVGMVEHKDNRVIPTENFNFTYIPEGTELYSNGENIMAYNSDYNVYFKLIPVE